MLLDVLLSKDVDHLSVRESIQNDLHRLFNTKRGSLRHMPHYGLPDLQAVYHSFPNGIAHFIELIQKAIETYEPRLSRVSVNSLNKEKKYCVISLTIHAEINHQESAVFDSDFYSAGQVSFS